MTKKQFRAFVRKTLRTALDKRDMVAQLVAVRTLAAMVLAQEFKAATPPGSGTPVFLRITRRSQITMLR